MLPLTAKQICHNSFESMDVRGFVVRFPAETRNFSLPQSVRTEPGMGPTQPRIQFLVWVKWPGRKTDTLTPTSDDIKN